MRLRADQVAQVRRALNRYRQTKDSLERISSTSRGGDPPDAVKHVRDYSYAAAAKHISTQARGAGLALGR